MFVMYMLYIVLMYFNGWLSEFCISKYEQFFGSQGSLYDNADDTQSLLGSGRSRDKTDFADASKSFEMTKSSERNKPSEGTRESSFNQTRSVEKSADHKDCKEKVFFLFLAEPLITEALFPVERR